MAHSRSGTEESVPSHKHLRKLRFSEGPDQVFVYESQPPSPKKVFALLPPPPAPESTELDSQQPSKNDEVEKKSPNKYNWKFTKGWNNKPQEEEHTPEAIRERYFPDEPLPSDNPTLAWMIPKGEDKLSDLQPSESHPVRYDLHGRVIPPRLVHALPTHLGLHHHGDRPEDAGYTLDEILLLSRSTLPAQRVAMLQVLAQLVERIRGGDVKREEKEDVSDILQKSLIVAIEAFGDRSSANVRLAGLEVLWIGLANSRGRNSNNILNEEQLDTLPMTYLFSATLFNFTRSSLPSSQIKIYEVLTSLTRSSSKLANEIIATSGLLNGAIRCSYSFESSGEEPRTTINATYLSALDLVQSLASTSRQCARALIPDISDSFIRNVLILPSSWKESPETSSLAVVAAILDFYAILGRYGLGSHIASTAEESFTKLATFVSLEVPLDITDGQELIRAWLGLHEVWIACAIDPHQTTPEHDIMWSRVMAWRWSNTMLALYRRLLSQRAATKFIWASWWRVWRVWIEGCRINEEDRGQREIAVWYEHSKGSWGENGIEGQILEDMVKQLHQPHPTQASNVELYASATACHAALLLLAELKVGSSATIPTPFTAENLLSILKRTTEGENWSVVISANDPTVVRVWTNLLVVILRALRTLHQDSIPQNALLDYQYNILQKLTPGDEMLAAELISDILQTTQQLRDEDLKIPEEIWNAAGGFAKILLPLYQYSLWPDEELFIGPFVPHGRALKMTTTLALPKQSTLPKTPSGGLIGITLPQKNPGDWMFAPLDILLRSGSTHTRLFRTLPADWTASETEVVRSLLILLLNRRTPITRSQILFSCMKIFMLEHNQGTQEGGEVYRDALVGSLMAKLLQPLRYSSSNVTNTLLSSSNPSLDVVAKEFLGAEQPFFQFYSDFLGLYDSASFGHKLFGELLLVPTSQAYARDFRRLLWGDYSHVLRSVEVEVDQMLCNSNEFKAWLWPVEGHQDGEMLGSYLQALLKHSPSGFPRFVGVHQIACCLWPDIIGEMDDKRQTAASRVLRAALTSTDSALLRDILHYNQAPEHDEPTLPPQCYKVSPSIIDARLKWAVDVCGEGIRARFPSG